MDGLATIKCWSMKKVELKLYGGFVSWLQNLVLRKPRLNMRMTPSPVISQNLGGICYSDSSNYPVVYPYGFGIDLEIRDVDLEPDMKTSLESLELEMCIFD